MDKSFNEEFSPEQVKSWLEVNELASEIIESISRDKLDGSDLFLVYKDAKESRFYFPNLKQRTRFNRLIEAASNRKDDQVMHSDPEPRLSSGNNLTRDCASSSRPLPSSSVPASVQQEVQYAYEDAAENGDDSMDAAVENIAVENATPSPKTSPGTRAAQKTDTPTRKKLLSVGDKRRRKERRKRQKALKKKAKLDSRKNEIMELSNMIEQLKSTNSASQSAMKMLQLKYQNLRKQMASMKDNNSHNSDPKMFVKEIRPEQLMVVKDEQNKDIVLGQGRFGKCKLMTFSVGGESMRVAVKEYNELTPKDAVIEEAFFLSQISHRTFPFVFGAVFCKPYNMLVLELCGITKGLEHSLTIFRALQLTNVDITENSWLHILMKCCEGFHFLHYSGIVHNDIKGDNILIAQNDFEVWEPKIIDFNKACQIQSAKIKNIPANRRMRYKSSYKHIDPALYDGKYAPGPLSDVYSFGYMASKIAQTKKSDLIEKFALTCMSSYKRLTFDILLRDLKAVISI